MISMADCVFGCYITMFLVGLVVFAILWARQGG